MCGSGVAVLYLLTLLYLWEFPAESPLGTWGCRRLLQVSQLTFASGVLSSPAHFHLPSLKVVLVSISPPPSRRHGTFEALFPRSLDRMAGGVNRSNSHKSSWLEEEEEEEREGWFWVRCSPAKRFFSCSSVTSSYNLTSCLK